MIRALMAAGAAFALVACGPTTTPTTTEAPATTEAPVTTPTTAGEATAQDTCGASQYSSLIGANAAATTFPAGANIRIIGPTTPTTRDFLAERLNVITDANGVITSLECY